MSEVKISPELHSEQASLLQSEYKLVKILKQSGGTDQTVSTGSVEVQFEIPGNRVINFAKSRLKWNTAFAAANIKQEHRGTLPIRRVRLTTRQGAILMDLSHAREYINAVGRPETAYSKFRTNTQDDGDLVAPFVGRQMSPAELTEWQAFFVVADVGGTAAAQLTAYDALDKTTAVGLELFSVAGAAASVAAADSASVHAAVIAACESYNSAGRYGSNQPLALNQSEPQVLFPLAAQATAGNSWDVKLSDCFPNTILSLDKSIYFGEVLILSITFGSRDDFGFQTANISDPSGTPAVLAGNVTMSNIGLYVAAEANHSVAQLKKNEVMSNGVMIPIDYVHSYKSLQNIGTGSVQLRFSGGHGQSLYRIYHTISVGTESLNNLNNNRLTSNDVASIYTMINDMRQQEYDLTLASDEDFSYLKSYFAGSTMQRLDMYRNMWSWVEDLGNGVRNPSSKGLRVGLDLTRAEQKWSLYANGQTANRNHNSFACCQKTLVINNSGVQVV